MCLGEASQREVIYLILIHTIIIMMIEIHKQQWMEKGNLCVAYETFTDAALGGNIRGDVEQLYAPLTKIE